MSPTAAAHGRRTALVTGASSGIGAAFARALAASHDLVLVARDETRLRAVADALPTSVEVLVVDLADREQLQQVEKRLSDPCRPIDLLVNNAGATTYAEVVDLDPGELARQIDVNVLAVVLLTRAVLPGLLARGRGGVLNVSSTASTGVAPALAAYCAGKAFVDSWSRSVAEAVRGAGVQVTCVRPGYTRTDFHRRAGQEVARVPAVYWLDPDQVVAQALAALAVGTVSVVPRAGHVVRARALTRRRVTRLLARLRGASTRPAA